MDEIPQRQLVTVEVVTAHYASAQCSSASENISKELVGCSTTGLRRMLTLLACAIIVMKFAEAGVQNPLGNSYKLSNIATRASKEDNLVWSCS